MAVQTQPAGHTLGPVQLIPPHWPHSGAVVIETVLGTLPEIDVAVVDHCRQYQRDGEVVGVQIHPAGHTVGPSHPVPPHWQIGRAHV